MSPMRVWASAMPTSTSLTLITSNFSGVILFSRDLKSLWRCSSTGSEVWYCPRSYLHRLASVQKLQDSA